MRKLTLLYFLLIGNAYADSTNTILTANASINTTCSFSSEPVSFGEISLNVAYSNVSPWGAIRTATSNISVLCNNKTSYNIKGKALQSKNGGKVGNFMSAAGDPSQQLMYNIYLHADLSNGWFADGASYSYDGGSGTTTTISSNGIGVVKNHALYLGLYSPKVFPGYWPKPDNYSDNYVLTLTY